MIYFCERRRPCKLDRTTRRTTPQHNKLHCQCIAEITNGSPHHAFCRDVLSVSLPQLLLCMWRATAGDEMAMPRHHAGPYTTPLTHRLPAN